MTLDELWKKTNRLDNGSTVYVVFDGMMLDVKEVTVDEDGDLLISAEDVADEDYYDDFEDEL